MTLYIDTTSGTHISIALAKEATVLAHKKIKAQYKQSEKLLVEINKMVSETSKRFPKPLKVQKNVDLKSIQGIVVVNGLGPFTATRIGVATANAFSYALNIKIASLRTDEFATIEEMVMKGWEKLKKIPKKSPPRSLRGGIEPVYDREPNITMPINAKRQVHSA
ncbi:hypothetical protein A2477_02090 [Candidatus Falkowbacteria bacterium RIFOXYC2_FULL_47_12]|uniref:Gcp-like domain-containing protein n=2 Tax=Candidatus Falkowiibacteriota TaxID=1752728 RepID=A0A1F5TQZ6_9BACT|nr:MAG: hypothetical protein A2242_02990 [Candidatus Falkowbacteria bacterium RIFOXYA2_FULL_47_9]OGF41390.1 MAG: hypothetical protein A2477_02090 [Candidatus Falkowbacteria bacterium RIFOXYC2_FULL_47_12]